LASSGFAPRSRRDSKHRREIRMKPSGTLSGVISIIGTSARAAHLLVARNAGSPAASALIAARSGIFRAH
jgi:hypothetical protein